MNCDFCGEEKENLYRPPIEMYDTQTGEEVERKMCKECIISTLEEIE